MAAGTPVSFSRRANFPSWGCWETAGAGKTPPCAPWRGWGDSVGVGTFFRSRLSPLLCVNGLSRVSPRGKITP